jgi:hydroxyacylglutathione hydrolase
MKIHTMFCHNSLRNVIHIFYDEKTKEAICVDPFDAEQVIRFLEQHQLRLKYIVNTHEHFDHIRGNQKLKKHSEALFIKRERGRGG